MIDFNKENSFVKLKDKKWLEDQRIAGKIASKSIEFLYDQVLSNTKKNLIQLNEEAEKIITESGGIPTFKGYKGFPAGVCISVNKQIVHGIPTDYELKDGDLVSFDLGVTYNGAIADTAITCIFGSPKIPNHKNLIESCRESLYSGIKAINVGKRLGVIGNAIYKYGKGKGFGVIHDYGGHGLDKDKPHAPPFVPNKQSQDEGIRIQSGLTIAIEPMLTIGSTVTSVLDDKWTVVTPDFGSHFEHSVFIHEDHVEILTHNKTDSIEPKLYFK